MVPFYELKDALLPFTDACQPELIFVRECKHPWRVTDDNAHAASEAMSVQKNPNHESQRRGKSEKRAGKSGDAQCGCWVETPDGSVNCPTCGTLVAGGKSTRAWTRRDHLVDQLGLEHRPAPGEVEDQEARLTSLEQQDYEPDWENQND
jgi:hypothetical protein